LSDTDDKKQEQEDAEKKVMDSAPPPRRNRGWIRYLILILVLGVGGYWGFQEVRSRFTHVYEYDARIAGSLITVSSRVAGWVTEMSVSEGDDISKGQVIVQIDFRESQLLAEQLVARVQGVEAERQRLIAEKGLVDVQTKSRYKTQKSVLGTSEAEVSSLKPQLQLARTEFRRTKSLFDKKIISRKQYDESQAREQQLSGEYRMAVAEVQAARDKLLEAEAERARLNVLDSEIAKLKYEEGWLRAQLKQQRLDLADRSIRGPVNGVVDKTFVEVGEYVTPGQRLALVHDPDTVWIEANVKETEVRKLKIGQEVDVAVDAYPGEGSFDRILGMVGIESHDNGSAEQEFVGHVIAIGNSTTAEFALLPSPNPSGNFTKITQRLPVRIAIDQKERKLRPGMMVEINIDIRDR
jgi:membrane fusion protein (multidrug efflux system)